MFNISTITPNKTMTGHDGRMGDVFAVGEGIPRATTTSSSHLSHIGRLCGGDRIELRDTLNAGSTHPPESLADDCESTSEDRS
jgi:hypothetical protein